MRRPIRGLILSSNVHVMADWQWQRAHHGLFLLQSVTSAVTPERFCHFALHRSITKAGKCPRASGQVLSLILMVTWPVFALISGPPTPRGPALSPTEKFQQSSAILTIFGQAPSRLDNPSRTTLHELHECLKCQLCRLNKCFIWTHCLTELFSVNTLLKPLVLQKCHTIVHK